MTADLHSRAKAIFLRAIELTPDDRPRYVREACASDLELRRETLGLLEYHDSRTLRLEGSALQSVVESQVRRRWWWPWLSQAEEPNQVRVSVAWKSPQIAEETACLLRDRLRGLLGVLAAILAIAILSNLIASDAPLVGFRLFVLGILLVIWALLFSRLAAELQILRFIEVATLVTVGTQLLVVQAFSLAESARRGDLAALVFATMWNYLGWSLLILAHGVFIPNTWRRAAAILVPAAAAPLLLALFVGWLWQSAHLAIEPGRIHMLWMVPPFCAAAAVYSAQISESARKAAFSARRFSQYRLIEKLGGGGMGDVYRAEHLLLKRRCAIKLIQPRLVKDPKTLCRFELEVRATARLTHWNTIQVYDCGQASDGSFYYVMELLDGLNLGEIVRQSGPLPPARVVHFLRQACGALQEAHQSGLVHRDIKPENIFATRLGIIYDVAKLLDFGVVHAEQAADDVRLTSCGTIVGTSLYMSPEQALASTEITARADLYSLGAVAYLLLTGQPPFVREHRSELLMAHIRDDVMPPSRISLGVPADLEQIVFRCLAKQPQDRFASAAELDAALAACQCNGQWSQEQAVDWWLGHGLTESRQSPPLA